MVEPKVKENTKPNVQKTRKTGYLRRLGCGILAKTIKAIEVYETIKNVAADGNCGFYSKIVGLNHMLIPVTESIPELRKQLYDYVEENSNTLFTQPDELSEKEKT